MRRRRDETLQASLASGRDQAFRDLVPVTNPRHLASRRSACHRHPKSPCQKGDQAGGFFSSPDTYQSTMPESRHTKFFQTLQQCEIRVDDPFCNYEPDVRAEYSPLDKAVATIELKNHHATSN